jgi:gliding motility-associated-like protein
VTPTSSTTYSVTGTTAAGCTGTSFVAVIVKPVPVVTATATPALICYGSSSTLNATSTIPGTAYDWMPGPLNGSTVTVNPLTTTIYTLTGTSPAGCTGSTNVIVTVSPPVVFTADIFEGCEDLLVSFSDLSNITNAVSWYWDFGDHSFSYLQNPQHLYIDPGVYNVTLTITSSTGCTTTYSWLNMITVHKVPNAFFAANPTNVDEMDPTVFFTDQSVGASGWNWYFGDINAMDNISNLQNPLHTYVGGVGTYTTTLIVNSDYGCADTVQHDINVLPTVTFYLPSAFTPNSDGTNEGFKGQGVGIKEETFEMIIYSRWGEELYRSTDINESWNGTDARKGGTCEEGVYVYIVSFTDKLGEFHTLKGTVTLVK